MANESDVAAWEVEPIPDSDELYKRVHRNLFKPDKTIMTGAFHHRSMSTDWAKYSSADDARNRAPTPDDNAVVKMAVSEVRQIQDLAVEHSPLSENRSHTDVVGKKSQKVQVLLRRISTLVIPLADPEA